MPLPPPPAPKSAGVCSKSCCPHAGPDGGFNIKVTVTDGKPIHDGVTCDVCNMPIAGVRYKCGNCADYDLCETCEAKNEHNADHLFIKMRLPRRMMVNRPLLPMVYPPVSTPAPKPESATVSPQSQPMTASKGKESERSVPASAIPVTSTEAQPKVEVATALKPVHVPLYPSPSATSTAHPKNKHHVSETTQFSAVFVEDVTIPDGTEVIPDEKFVKIWSVANMGDSEWPMGTVLVHMGGAPTMTGIRNSAPIVVGKRYEQVGVAADLQAPQLPGRYTSMWRLMTPQGQYFGSMLWCTIEVKAPAEAKPAEVKLAEAEPVEVKLVAAKPAEAILPEAEPVEVKLVEAKPTEAILPEVKPVETTTSADIDRNLDAENVSVSETSSGLRISPPAVVNELAATSTQAATDVSSASTASIESLSNTFVKIGADLMTEIRRLE
ncbi:hypothetical protein IW150_007136, partial [Coemansia sp. RSA 2607]